MIKKKGKMVDFQIVNMGEMNFEDQLKLMRRTNILGNKIIIIYEIDLLRYIWYLHHILVEIELFILDICDHIYYNYIISYVLFSSHISSHILVGVHGAGLMHSLFMGEK